MIIPIITDTHFGVSKDDDFFIQHQFRFIENVFFPYLQKNENKNTSGFSKLFEKNKEYKPNNTQAIKREAEPQRIDTLKNDSFANQNRFEAEKNRVVKIEKNFNIPNISSAPLVRKNKISFN